MTPASLIAERQTTHGDFATKSAFIQSSKAAMRRAPNWANLSPAQREALDLIETKRGRILFGDADTLDHWMDIAGYATLGGHHGKA